MLITFKHLRTLPFRRRNGYCIPGAIRFFERYNLDWDDFVHNGIDSDVLLSASDNNALAIKIIEYAESLEPKE